MSTVVRITGEGAETEATAEVRRYSPGRRTGMAVTFVLLGVGAAAAAAIVPTPHILCTTWLFPLIGGVLGYTTYKTEVRVSDIKGPCPACEADLRLVGGASTTIEIPCPKCFKPLTVDAGEASGAS